MERNKNWYAVTYSANNGSWNSTPYYYSSLREAIAAGKEIVRREHFPQRGNKSYITVIDTLNGKSVYEGLLWGTHARFLNLTED